MFAPDDLVWRQIELCKLLLERLARTREFTGAIAETVDQFDDKGRFESSIVIGKARPLQVCWCRCSIPQDPICKLIGFLPLDAAIDNAVGRAAKVLDENNAQR